MDCLNCGQPLSFISRKIILKTEYGEFKTQTVQVPVADHAMVQLCVICQNCQASHDIGYGNGELIQAHDKDENRLDQGD